MVKKITANEPFTPRPLRKHDMLQDLYSDLLKCAKKKKLLKSVAKKEI